MIPTLLEIFELLGLDLAACIDLLPAKRFFLRWNSLIPLIDRLSRHAGHRDIYIIWKRFRPQTPDRHLSYSYKQPQDYRPNVERGRNLRWVLESPLSCNSLRYSRFKRRKNTEPIRHALRTPKTTTTCKNHMTRYTQAFGDRRRYVNKHELKLFQRTDAT
jgi:hypothetical protein